MRMALALCLALCGTARAADSDWVYPDLEGRYQIALPPAWTATRVNNSRLLIRWSDSTTTREACNVVVVDDSFTRSYSQAELDMAIRGGLFAVLPVKQIGQIHPEAKLKDGKIIEFQGHPAQSAEVTLTAHVADRDVAGEEYTYYFAVPGRTYKEYCDINADHFAQMKPALDRMIRSLDVARAVER
jgi:hypothetical protein